MLDVPAMRLPDGLAKLNSATGIVVGGTAPGLAAARGRAVRGRIAPAVALKRMLEGTGYRALKVASDTYRLIAEPPRPRPADPGLANDGEFAVAGDIVVTASKRALRLKAMGGAAEIATFDDTLSAKERNVGTSALTSRITSLNSTNLGPARNKLSIRGISDSSFTGTARPTVSQYLGEAPIDVNSTDPDLHLYDVNRVEVLKGPQGTLYGAGALGGVVRIVPNNPDLGRSGGAVDFSTTATTHGALGVGASATINIPLIDNRLGFRAVAYHDVAGGYIDDRLRAVSDINRTVVSGGRATLRAIVADWTIDLSAVRQDVRTNDSQYVEPAGGDLARRSAVAQPFSAHLSLAALTARHVLGSVEIVTTNSVLREHRQASYDASSLTMAPTAFQDRNSIDRFAHETRFAQSSANGNGWVVGGAVNLRRQRADQSLGSIAAAATSMSERDSEFAVFGEISHRFGRLLATGGMRVIRDGQRLDTASLDPVPYHPSQLPQDWHVLPTAELAFTINPDLVASVGYREGIRTATGQIVHRYQKAPIAFTSFWTEIDPDQLRVLDVGIAYDTHGNNPISLTATLSGADWIHVQSDLLDEFGFVQTANVGSVRFINLDAGARWRPMRSIEISLGASWIAGRFGGFAPLRGSRIQSLASVPDLAIYVALGWSRQVAADWRLALDARATYRGKSRLGVLDYAGLAQGRLITSGLGLTLSHGDYSASLAIDNLADTRRNEFSFGNPFVPFERAQATPPRPRNITLAVHANF